ncbi:MAG TPA: DUF4199 domain-containing protein [Chitinophagaceae bacterium]
METKTVTSPAVKGIIISLILIVFNQVIIATDQVGNQALGWVPMLLFIGAVIWGCINFANQKEHNVSFGNVFAHGFKISAAVAAIMAVYMLLLFLFIYPELQDISLQKARETLEKRNMSDSEIDNALSMSKRMIIPFAVGGAVLMYVIMGCIASLIGGGVAKKNPNPGPFQQQ